MTAEVVSKVVTRFGCSSCRKTWANKKPATSHVADGCIHDPETRACPTCKHDYRGYIGSYDEGPGDDASCDLGLRDADDLYVRGCPSWTPNAYIASLAAGVR